MKLERIGISLFIFFFFSSRRRHTRLVSDWSSDVCSSDLVFTTDRIIVARTVGQMSDPLGSATYWVTTDAERLRGLDLETILSADEENFSVTYAEITKIEVGSKWRNSRANVYTRTRVYKFMWTWPAKLEDVEAPLRELLPKNITLQRVNKLD